jgi:acyl-CoA synthetase (AMP-forming)/AMP-acid ligase II
MSVAITTEVDVGGWNVRRNPYLAAWAEREGLWPGKTVAQFAHERFKAEPDRVMLIDNGVRKTAAEIYRAAAAVAGYLRSVGVGPGDVVSFQLPNWWEANVVNLATAILGAVANPILPINRDAEVSYILGDTRAKAIFAPAEYRKFDYAAMLDRIVAKARPDLNVVLVRSGGGGAFASFEEVAAFPHPVEQPLAVDGDAVKLILYTSGTTGRPKGVLHSHNSINADSIKMTKAIGLGPSDISFIPSPVTHVTGYLWVLNVPWCCNVPAASIDVWEPEQAFDALVEHQCAFMAGATPFLRDLVNVAQTRGVTLTGLRNFLCGGASVPPTLVYLAAEVFPNCIPWRNYGSTEAPTQTRCPESRTDLRLGAETDGRIYQCEMSIRDPATGERVPYGQEGEICVREPSMALGYVHSEDNAAAYDAEGFFRMGDVGRLVETDHILITDRLKDIIIRSGENLSSKEIEDALLGAPEIADAAIVGVPNAKTGEAVFAFLVTRGGADMSLPRLMEIIQGAGLAKQKTPEHFAVVDQLPRTASGKVLKHELRPQARRMAEETAG